MLLQHPAKPSLMHLQPTPLPAPLPLRSCHTELRRPPPTSTDLHRPATSPWPRTYPMSRATTLAAPTAGAAPPASPTQSATDTCNSHLAPRAYTYPWPFMEHVFNIHGASIPASRSHPTFPSTAPPLSTPSPCLAPRTPPVPEPEAGQADDASPPQQHEFWSFLKLEQLEFLSTLKQDSRSSGPP